ncbi:MAG TPA: PLDc N-terminal domain-containing protein [Chitinophagaceae bacterium]|nr:PLDc N-terminal domain-containing protein [Chitinophagaceae bacterium]
MTRSSKIFLGFLTFLPFILFAIYIAVFTTFFFEVIRHQNVEPEFVFAEVYPIIVSAVLLGLSSLGLLIYYIIHAVNNKKIDSSERLVWILVFLFAGMIGFPIYWYMRVWKETTDDGQLTR